ncbi:hypothetical protein ACFWDA_20265, partial [Rhodococcus zopfii]
MTFVPGETRCRSFCRASRRIPPGVLDIPWGVYGSLVCSEDESTPTEEPMILEQYYIECLSHASYLIADESTGRAI